MDLHSHAVGEVPDDIVHQYEGVEPDCHWFESAGEKEVLQQLLVTSWEDQPESHLQEVEYLLRNLDAEQSLNPWMCHSPEEEEEEEEAEGEEW